MLYLLFEFNLTTGTDMSSITWIVLGLVAVFIASKLVNLFGMHGVTGLNIYSSVVAIAGAVVLLVLYHVVRRVAY
jgi:uncharacterized membrane protein YeaQ/YmgE (transglycosylase-associated protein family)